MNIVKYEAYMDSNYMSEADYYAEINKLLKSIISPHNWETPDDMRRLENSIIKSYMDNFKFSKGPPDVEDIVMDIMNDNWEIIMGIAYIDYNYGDGRSGYSDYLDRDMYTDDDECVVALAESWAEDYLQNIDGLYELVESIIFSSRHCYKNPFDSPLIAKPTSDVFINDCQNLLLDEWHIESILGVSTGHRYFDECELLEYSLWNK